MSRKSYDREFKLYAVKMVLEDGSKVSEVERKLDLVHQTFHKWLAKYKEDQEDSFVGSGSLSPKEEAEYKKDKRIRDLEEENAILKKLWASSQKTRSNLRLHKKTPTRIPCSEDVPTIRCF